MGRLIYGMITSLDGYVADEEGKFDWSVPDQEVHTFINGMEERIGTAIYGRKLYEVMKVWQTYESSEPAEVAYAALWKGQEKVVVSTTLAAVETPRTTLVRSLDVATIARMKAEASRDLSIGGPTLAAEAIRAGLVDELYSLQSPVVVGGGLRALPDGAKLDLELVEERRFGNGVVFTRYRPRSNSA